MKTRDIYTAAVKKCGKEHQLVLCMEEMAELTKELSKNMKALRTQPIFQRKWLMWKSCLSSSVSFTATVQKLTP